MACLSVLFAHLPRLRAAYQSLSVSIGIACMCVTRVQQYLRLVAISMESMVKRLVFCIPALLF